MKAHERRELTAYPYFKVAKWDERAFAWKAGRAAFETEGEAHASVAGVRGRYRVTRIDEASKTELTPFVI